MELFIPYVYDPSKSTTDMQNMPKYCLKLYGMNLEDFFRLLKGEPLEPRGGSAAIQGQYDAFGIPTGHKKGFTSLQEILVMHDGIRTTVQAVINLAFHGLEKKIMNGEFTSVVWPAVEGIYVHEWEKSIFEVGHDVRVYIARNIDRLSHMQTIIDKLTPPIVTDLTKLYEFPK